ncbi:putative metallo-dependent phosphatase [Thermacetogenium phaeum DSM 12270]|uniref:Putative metallo-dependent phosphatase n=1 Tax=Thermacetogenium phaeum (strain ATCC BAA-254 / DSM 26808 / PB) TaxID=1089553 RepID=K4LXK8_THEPS|nr:metallophosphoesterase [Thermacetogenium phaeum]AFV12714.1 putative metallo-dependent phosphatase [Thermacetogenium phaeum DSM 12270]
MKLLHTADVHLTPGAPERMEAFRTVCRMVQELACAALVVAGDLFDSPEAALDLRAEVRELLESVEGEVFVIPGNHDAEAFRSGEYYGRNVHVCCGPEAFRWEVDGVPVVGVPYLPGREGGEALRRLALRQESSPLVALVHANFYSSSLSACYFLKENGHSGAACLWDRDFEDFPPSYIALGHWHNPTLPAFAVNDVRAAYSGTPYPLARRETGERRVFLVEVSPEGVFPQGVKIPGVPRRERVPFFFVPGEEEKTLEEMRLFLERGGSDQVILDLEVDGWVANVSEEACAGEILSLVDRYRDRWRDVNTGTLRITGVSALPGIARRCLQFLRESEPPAVDALEDCGEPCLRELAREVREDREGIYRQALSFIMRYLGTVK